MRVFLRFLVCSYIDRKGILDYEMTEYEKAFQSYEQYLAPLLEAELMDFMPALGQARFFESDPDLRATMLRMDISRNVQVQHLFLKMQMSGEVWYDRMLTALEQSKIDRLVEVAHKIRTSLTCNRTTWTQEVRSSEEEMGSHCSTTTSQPVFPATINYPQDACTPNSSTAGLGGSEMSTRQCIASNWLSVVQNFCQSAQYEKAFEYFIESLRKYCEEDTSFSEEATGPSMKQRDRACYFWKVFSRGVSPLKAHPDATCAQGILARKVRGEAYTFLYRLRRENSKVSEKFVERCLKLNIPPDLKVVVANAGLSRRNESEKVLPLLYDLLELAEKGACDNYDITVCTLRVHIASVLCHKGDLQLARKEITPGLQSAVKISDPTLIEAGWVHGWLLFLESQQGEKAFSTDHEKAIDDIYSQTLARLQNEKQWFRDLFEAFKLGKADTHLRIAKAHIALEGSHDSGVVYQLLQRARDSLLSINMELLGQSHGNDPFTEAFRNHLWFMYHHLQGNHVEADTFLHQAFDNWIASKGYKFAKEIAEMANNTHLLQQLKSLGV